MVAVLTIIVPASWIGVSCVSFLEMPIWYWVHPCDVGVNQYIHYEFVYVLLVARLQ